MPMCPRYRRNCPGVSPHEIRSRPVWNPGAGAVGVDRPGVHHRRGAATAVRAGRTLSLRMASRLVRSGPVHLPVGRHRLSIFRVADMKNTASLFRRFATTALAVIAALAVGSYLWAY